MGSNKAFWMGKRVQIPAYADNWMRGDRYGEVVLVGTVSGKTLLKVKGDKGTASTVWANDCEVINTWGAAVLAVGAL